jgi:glycosyltransferase involved in cell wall biosynthesis
MKISVYITSYNQKEYLIQAVQSVLSQTLKPSQIVLVDDCSTDGSREVIEGYVSRYADLITPIYHAQNQGVARSRIDGVEAATGDYVSHVDGDDRFLPSKLEKEAALLTDTANAQIAFSDYYYIDDEGSRTGHWTDSQKPPVRDVFCRTFARDFPKRSLFRNELTERQAWKEIGYYDPNLSLYEDYEMLIRLTKQLRVAYHDEPLSEYRIHEAGLSRARAAEHLAALSYIYEKNKYLLDDLTPEAKTQVESKLREWMARIATRALDEAIEDAQRQEGRAQALRQYLRLARTHPSHSVRLRPILRLLLPDAAYDSLRAASRRARLYGRAVRR